MLPCIPLGIGDEQALNPSCYLPLKELPAMSPLYQAYKPMGIMWCRVRNFTLLQQSPHCNPMVFHVVGHGFLMWTCAP